MPPCPNSPVLLPDVLAHVERSLLQIWAETGCGHLALHSRKQGQNQVVLTLQGASHYYFVVHESEIRQALSQGSICYSHQINSAIAQQVEHFLLHIWQETGYGSVIFDSERCRDRIALTVQGGISHRYLLPTGG